MTLIRRTIHRSQSLLMVTYKLTWQYGSVDAGPDDLAAGWDGLHKEPACPSFCRLKNRPKSSHLHLVRVL